MMSKTTAKKAELVEVRALPFFHTIRFVAFADNWPGVIDKEQYRTLQGGDSVKIKKTDFEKTQRFFEEVENNG